MNKNWKRRGFFGLLGYYQRRGEKKAAPNQAAFNHFEHKHMQEKEPKPCPSNWGKKVVKIPAIVLTNCRFIVKSWFFFEFLKF
ncbi:MAG: hypothetical protein IPG53_05855 [Ignavibacteriales bacterium]|nr:hypothetical protein [Ignavibacteriales bacterium]